MVSLNAHFLPSLTTPEQLSGATAVVIDVLRASTTIIQALAAGATSVRPCLSVDDALEFARQGGDDVLLGVSAAA
jgi:2-phosphosulfolactate phosphatase